MLQKGKTVFIYDELVLDSNVSHQQWWNLFQYWREGNYFCFVYQADLLQAGSLQYRWDGLFSLLAKYWLDELNSALLKLGGEGLWSHALFITVLLKFFYLPLLKKVGENLKWAYCGTDWMYLQILRELADVVAKLFNNYIWKVMVMGEVLKESSVNPLVRKRIQGATRWSASLQPRGRWWINSYFQTYKWPRDNWEKRAWIYIGKVMPTQANSFDGVTSLVGERRSSRFCLCLLRWFFHYILKERLKKYVLGKWITRRIQKRAECVSPSHQRCDQWHEIHLKEFISVIP